MRRPHYVAAFLANLVFAAYVPAVFGADAPALNPEPTGQVNAVVTTAPTYTINLSPSWKVGQKFGFEAVGSQSLHAVTTVTGLDGNGTPRNQEQNKNIISHIKADGEVLAVFPGGGIQKEALTVQTFSVTDDGKDVTGLPGAGVKIVAERKDKDDLVLTIDDKPASDNIAALLGSVVTLESATHPDQEVYGSKDPVTVGVAWPANEAVLLEIARNDLGGATAAKGTMKLENVEGAGDNQVFNISGNILFEGVKSPITAPLTPGPAVVKAQLTRSIPATAGKGVLKQSSITSLEASGFADMPSASPSGSSTPINVHAEVMVTEQKKWGVEITFR